jgi:cytochrome c oxidase subunit II
MAMFNRKTILQLVLLCVCCGGGAASADSSGGVIEIHAHRFSFDPSEIRVKKGETVKLKLVSDDVPHSLLIKDLGINQVIVKGKPAVVTFTPQKTGDFRGQCGRFCGAGHGKMAMVVHVTGN